MMSEARDDVGCHCCKVVQIHGFTEIESSKMFVWVGGLMKCVSYFTYGIVCAVYSYVTSSRLALQFFGEFRRAENQEGHTSDSGLARPPSTEAPKWRPMSNNANRNKSVYHRGIDRISKRDNRYHVSGLQAKEKLPMPKKILKESYDLWTTFECLKMSLTYFYII